MSSLLRLVFIVPLAYIFGCIAAGLTIYAAWQSSGFVLQGAQFELFLGSALIAMAFGAVAFPVSVVAIIIAEAFRIQSFVWFVLLGMLNGYILSLTLPELHTYFSYPSLIEVNATQGFPTNATAYLAGGSAFGLVYWLLVGRASGIGDAESG